MKTYQDFCEVITKQIFDIIDQKGSLLKWQKDWDSRGCEKLPFGSKGLYHGANLFSLLFAQWKKGFKSNLWLTFNQINKQGGCVQKGAKSEEVFFWKIEAGNASSEAEEKEGKQNKQNDEGNNKENEKNRKGREQKPIFKTYRVFNLEQTTFELNTFVSEQFQCQTVDLLVNKLGVSISHFGNRACYNGDNDTIILPNPNCFISKENYYTTLLHEVMHCVAVEKRLPRECFKKYHEDRKARAEEELIAEIGSVLLAAYYGLKGELENHASYVQSWKQDLSEKQVIGAVNKAAKAFEWIVNQADAA